MFKKKLVGVLVASTFSLASVVQSADLNSVLTQALAQDPDVLEAANVRMSRLQEIDQAKAGYKPTLDLNAGYGWEYTDSPSTRTRLDPPDDHGDEDLHRGEFGLTLRQTIFDGKYTDNDVDLQSARTDSATNRLYAVSDDISLDIVKAYLDVIYQRRVLELSEENLQVHQRIQDQIRLRSDAGVGRRADLDQINARVALVEANLIASKVNVQDAITTYKRRTGVEPEEILESVPSMKEALPADVDAAIEMGKAENPVLKQAGSDIEAANAANRAASSNDYPFIYFEATYGLDNNLDGTPGHYNDATAMLKMQYNLYNGGRDQAKKKQTAYQIQEASEIRNRTVRQIEEEVRLAWAALRATEMQLEQLEKQVEFSIATREAYSKQFNIGQRTLLDLLNTDNELYDAKVSLAGAKSDNLYAQYRILAAMGKLTKTMEIDLTALNDIPLAETEEN